MDSTKLKLVFIHQDGDITGSAISLAMMIRSLNSYGHNIIVIIPKHGQAISIWQKEGASVYIHPFTTFWTSPGPRCVSRGFIRQLKAIIPNIKLRNFILSLEPDLIHINDKAAFNAGISLKYSRKPIIQHSRSAYQLTACRLNAIISAYSIRSYAKHIICISEDEMQGFEEIKNKSILYNTVDIELAKKARKERDILRSELGIKPDDIVIGMAETFNINKGLKEIIQVAKYCLEKHNKKVKFLLVGSMSSSDNIGAKKISTKKYISEFIQVNNYASNFILTGFKSDVLRYIAAMDIIIVAKAHGVVGRQPIEAQACGTAVIGLNGHSKKSTVVSNGIGGYLLNSCVEICEKLDELIENPATLRHLQMNGPLYASKHFNPSMYSNSLLQIYNNYLPPKNQKY